VSATVHGAAEAWSAPDDLRARPLVFLMRKSAGALGTTSGQLPGTCARIGEDRVDQPRHRPVPVGQCGTYRAAHAGTGDPGTGLAAKRPARRPDVVQSFNRAVLCDAALPARPRGRQLGAGRRKSFRSFRQPRGTACSEPDRRGVQRHHLAAETFNPMSSLRASVVKLATTVSTRRKPNGSDNNDEHHRDQQDRSQQDGGHRIDSTPEGTVVTDISGRRHRPTGGPGV
jgi:hypothetical protein